jgi:hypothetical protein
MEGAAKEGKVHLNTVVHRSGSVLVLVLAALLLGTAAAPVSAQAPRQCSLSHGGYSGSNGPPESGPTASFFFAPSSPAVGEQVTFDGRASRDADGDTLVAYRWNFGDGTPVQTTSGPQTTHAFAGSGFFNVSLNVIDCRDNVSHTAQAAVAVGRRGVLGTSSSSGSITSTAAPDVAGGGVTINLACGHTAAQGPCAGTVDLTTIEILKGRRITGLTSRRRSAAVGSASFTIPAGHVLGVTVNLNRTGKRLLKRRRLVRRTHGLPVQLTVSESLPGGQTARDIALSLTIPRKPRGR